MCGRDSSPAASVPELQGQLLRGPRGHRRGRDPDGALLPTDHLLPLAEVVPRDKQGQWQAVWKAASGLCLNTQPPPGTKLSLTKLGAALTDDSRLGARRAPGGQGGSGRPPRPDTAAWCPPRGPTPPEPGDTVSCRLQTTRARRKPGPGHVVLER